MLCKVIPEYAKDYKKEYLLIRGINKSCGELLQRLDFGGNLFNSSLANNIKYSIKRFLKAQEKSRLKDVSEFYLKYYDAKDIEILFEQLDCYCEFYYDPDSCEFNQEYYDLYIERDYPGFRELYELVSLFNEKIKTEYEEIIFIDSDGEIDGDIF